MRHINSVTREAEAPLHKLCGKDFVPGIGLIQYVERNRDSEEDNAAHYGGRLVALGMANTAYALASAGLVEMLIK